MLQHAALHVDWSSQIRKSHVPKVEVVMRSQTFCQVQLYTSWPFVDDLTHNAVVLHVRQVHDRAK